MVWFAVKLTVKILKLLNKKKDWFEREIPTRSLLKSKYVMYALLNNFLMSHVGTKSHYQFTLIL